MERADTNEFGCVNFEFVAHTNGFGRVLGG